MFGVEARFPWRPGLCTRQSPAEARTVLQNKRYGCESVGESQSLSEVASGKEQAGAWHRVASKRRVRRVFRPEILSSSNHSTHGRHENAQLACHSVPGEAGWNRFSSAEPLSSSTWSGSPTHSSFGGRVSRPSVGLSGPKFFPSSFDDLSPRKRLKRVRSKRVAPSPSPEQLLRRQVKKRLGLWKKMRDVLLCHKHVPEEALLLDIAEQEGVKDNEEGLEGWTAYQLLHKASEGATKGFEILTLAVDDIVSSLSSRGHHKFRIRCSNIIQWRTETHPPTGNAPSERSTAGCSGGHAQGRF